MGAAEGAFGLCGRGAVCVAAGSPCCASRRHCNSQNCYCKNIACGETCLPNHSGKPSVDAVGRLHRADVPHGVLGIFSNQEPVVGIRAGMLPYVQAIGHRNEHVHEPSAKTSISQHVHYAVPSCDQYTFSNFSFMLLAVPTDDDVIIAFGTRSVLRIQMFRSSGDFLDFNVLGSVRVPLRQLLEVAEPVDICVPILSPAESLPLLAIVCLSLVACRREASQAALGTPVYQMRGQLMEKVDSSDSDEDRIVEPCGHE